MRASLASFFDLFVASIISDATTRGVFRKCRKVRVEYEFWRTVIRLVEKGASSPSTYCFWGEGGFVETHKGRNARFRVDGEHVEAIRSTVERIECADGDCEELADSSEPLSKRARAQLKTTRIEGAKISPSPCSNRLLWKLSIAPIPLELAVAAPHLF
jgi:hypothetical protein